MGTLDYTGHQGDPSGLVYMGARYYDPEIGRFLSMDPASFSPGNVQSFNRYAYANNNPYRYVDPDGELPFLVPLLIFVGKEAAGYVFEEITGLPAPTMKNLGKAGLRLAARGARKRARAPTRSSGKRCCFVAGTPVKTIDGMKPIETIELGDLVYAADPETGEHAYKAVTKLYRSNARELYALKVQLAGHDPEVLHVTDDHPFWVEEKGWVDAVELEAGMTLRGLQGIPLDVLELVALGRQGDTFNLEVADFHTFFAGDSSVLVHNCDGEDGKSEAARRRTSRSFDTGGPTTLRPTRFPDGDSQTKHIFRDAPGHIADTPANRRLLQQVADDRNRTLGTDRFGNTWSARNQADGTQVWTQVRNGVIQNGGVNQVPRSFSPKTGLSGR